MAAPEQFLSSEALEQARKMLLHDAMRRASLIVNAVGKDECVLQASYSL